MRAILAVLVVAILAVPTWRFATSKIRAIGGHSPHAVRWVGK